MQKKQTLTLIAAVLLMLAPVFASDDGKTKTIEKDVIFTAPVPPPFLAVNPMPFDQMIDIKVVTGAPYSAVANTEAVQTLADGNRIVRRNSTQVARDGQGRTRHEYSFTAPMDDTKPMTIISISDPTTGVSYTVHSETKTAEKIGLPEMLPGGEPSGDITYKVEAGDQAIGPKTTTQHVFIRKDGPDGGEMGTVASVGAAHIARFRVTTGGAIDDNANTEQLGKQVIEGLETEGKRTTITIPAGQIGNEQPIVITNEVWYSPELQTIVYSKRDDPMAGTTIFKLTNIVRAEPDAALFQVPPDYKVESIFEKKPYLQYKVTKPEKK